MTGEPASFGSAAYGAWLGVLLTARGADFLSTWVATPNLVLEGNPIARRLGWRFGALVNLIACAVCALLPIAAIVVATTSVLVAARNFQSAWVMRTMGETAYRHWYASRLREAPRPLYLVCLGAQAALTSSIGVALITWAPLDSIPFALGIGVLFYAGAILLFSLIAAWRIQRH